MGNKRKVNILIPMAGRGSRFANEGFVQPKPLIDVGGKKMITWVLDNVDSDLIEATFILLILKEQQDKNDLISQLKPLKPNMKFVIVDKVTEGAACTALLAREYINNDEPLFIANSDQFVEWDADVFWKDRLAANDEGIDGDVLCFHVPMSKNDTKWSYAAIGSDNYITEIREKVVISENATVGMYYWRQGSDYVESAEAMIAADDRVKGEFYVAPAYNYGVNKFKRKYTVSFCKKMWGLGVPHDLVTFLSDYARPMLSEDVLEDACQKEYFGRTSGPMIFISHRGNIDGPNPEKENSPDYISRALSFGFDVEIDAWLDDATGQWSLGHNEPQHPVGYDFLLKPGLWVRAKNGAALKVLSQDSRIHCFTQGKDDYTLTSNGLMWAFPDKPLLGPRCIAAMYSKPENLLQHDIAGICHDVVGPLRDQYLALRAKDDTVCSTKRTIRLVVFDLDGVLVESRDLHYEALNRALEEEAGAQYVISREEHEHVYDGLSTNQKLRMLEVAKDLPEKLHKNVWSRKQALTEELVKEILRPSSHITDAIISLKKQRLPVCVASNCIRSSVKTILEQIGVMRHVDVFLSNEDVTNAKPAPDMYSKACQVFGVDPNNTLVVEDSTKGFEAASRAGCHLFRVSNPEDVTESSLKSRINELESLTEDVTVVLPLAGPYPEMWNDRKISEMPIFLADASGVSILESVGKSLLSRRYNIKYIFVLKESVVNAYNVEALCAKAVNYAQIQIVKIKTDTLSSIHTILQIPAGSIPENAPLLVADGSHSPVWEEGESLDNLLGTHSDGAMTVLQSIDSRLSYVRLNADTISKGLTKNSVIEVTMEYTPASNLACSGLYYFRRAIHFFEAAKSVIANNERCRGRFYTAQLFNYLIEQGLIVQALHLSHAWSLRTASEVKDFERFALPLSVVEKLGDIYNEMIERQNGDLNEKGAVCDPNLIKSEIVPATGRRCLAVYSLCNSSNWHPNRHLLQFLDQVKELLGPNHCYYEPFHEKNPEKTCSGVLTSVMHWTFCELISFKYFDKVKVPDGYGDVVEGTLLRYLPCLKINFTRLALTPSSIMLLGFPSADINSARFQLRRALKRCGLPLFEPNSNDMIDMTLVRFASPISDSALTKLREVITSTDTMSFGRLAVDQLALSPATWKMQPQELEQHETRIIKLL